MNTHKHFAPIFNFFKLCRSNSVFVRDFIVSFVIIAIPFALISLLFYNNGKTSLEKQIEESNNSNLLRCSEIIDTMISDTDTVSAYISMQNDINFYAWGNKDVDVNGIYQNLRQITMPRNYIDSLFIYSDVSKSIITGTNSFPLNEMRDSGWHDIYSGLNNTSTDSSISLRLKNNTYPYLITIIKPVLSADKSSKSGAVIININIEKLLKQLGSESAADSLLILDDKNTVICANDYNNIGLKLNVKYNSEKSTYSDIEKKNIVSVRKSKSCGGINYALTMPINTYVSEFSSLFYNTKTFIIFALLFCIMLSIFTAFRSYSAIKTIMDVFKKHGIYYTSDSDKSSELDFITSNIITHIETNKTMRQEFFKQYNELQKSQTAVLQSQITPHFLRNTLEVINLKAFEEFNGINPISDMLACLGDMMNSFIESDNYIISIQKEYEYSCIYVNLLNIRYENSFKIDWNIPENIKQYHMLKLSLQPIIENSIFHGIKPGGDNGKICISGCDCDKYISIIIDDNGGSLSDADIENLQQSLTAPNRKRKNIGIINVHKRYQIVFGQKYGLTLERSPLGGLRVIISFPKYTV